LLLNLFSVFYCRSCGLTTPLRNLQRIFWTCSLWPLKPGPVSRSRLWWSFSYCASSNWSFYLATSSGSIHLLKSKKKSPGWKHWSVILVWFGKAVVVQYKNLSFNFLSHCCHSIQVQVFMLCWCCLLYYISIKY